jgi:peptide/nickel transport system substrate-binding protein
MRSFTMANSWRSALKFILFAAVAALILAGCQMGGETNEEFHVPVVAPAEEETGYPLEEPSLIICIGQEPDSLYMYNTDMLASAQVLEAIYDGGAGIDDGATDNRSFSYQPVIIEKIPSLADNDAVINKVVVSEGDRAVDKDGNPITLAAPDPEGTEDVQWIKPAGCQSVDCAVEYKGGQVELDQMAVTFKLLPDLKWSDGQPVTAEDSLYSFRLDADPDTPDSKYKVDRTASYQALDSHTLLWTGLPGYLDSTYFLNIWTPAPEHVWSKYTALELLTAEESSRLPMGYGPYLIKEWNPGKSIILEKNPNYFRADEDLPHFKNVVYRVVGENSTANLASIISGECDIVDQTSNLENKITALLKLQNDGYLKASMVTGTLWEHADFAIKPVSYDDGYNPKQDRPDFFGDVRTRRAIAMCMDRQAVVDAVMYSESTVLDTYLPPQHPLFNSHVTEYPYDVQAGSALLEEVGWVMGDDGVRVARGVENVPDGTRLSFSYYTTPADQRINTVGILSKSMALCGIQVNPEYLPADDFYSAGPQGVLLGRNYDMAQFAWGTGVEPPCRLWISDNISGPLGESPAWNEDVKFCGWGCENNVGFSDPEFDAACKAALSALPGQPEYTLNHFKAQQIFAEELPVIPLYLRLKIAATRPDMCNFEVDPTSDSEMWNIEAFAYGDMCDQ